MCSTGSFAISFLPIAVRRNNSQAAYEVHDCVVNAETGLLCFLATIEFVAYLAEECIQVV